MFSPLLKDISFLEDEGVFIEYLGRNVRGTVLCVFADNLEAHGLGGFTEPFRSRYVCRFCLATRDQMQSLSVLQGDFPMRTEASHDIHVHDVLQSDTQSSQFGVKGDCVLREALKHFHPVTGFAPDVLHDLLEGIVPIELSLCLQKFY